jgi:hypothetical protein
LPTLPTSIGSASIAGRAEVDLAGSISVGVIV